ncbi:MAG TPA: hypothetical protein PLU53_01070 [Bacteroidia bacterium]|nr:hypothetical protein [Bacteroidia bacterium]
MKFSKSSENEYLLLKNIPEYSCQFVLLRDCGCHLNTEEYPSTEGVPVRSGLA